jgi:perosamine synthetase
MNKFIPISRPSVTEKEVEYVTEAVRSTWISSLGKYIDRFESEFAQFCGVKYAVAVMNGTVAIQLALDACGIQPGDEVIVPDLSFIATANAVLYIGAVPVFVDVDPVTFCLDPEKTEAAITSKTRAILPVHLYGHPADMPKINVIAEKYKLHVIEDAAEAHGATIHGKKTGGWGNCATFSFYGNKNITTGEGGMVTTNDEAIYNRCRFLRDHAMSKEKRYWHPEMGYNFRMTNIQAAIGCAQLERVNQIMDARTRVFETYRQYLQDCDKICLNHTMPWATNAYWLITARFKGFDEKKRDVLMNKLKEKGIDSRPFFYPMSAMPYFNVQVNNPVTYQVYQEGINLPTYFDLSDSEIRYISEQLKIIIEKE